MKPVTRVVAVSALVGLTTAMMGQVAIPQKPAVSTKQNPGFYRGHLGSFEVIALSDGTAPRHVDRILSDPKLVRDELAANHQSELVSLSINAYVINTGSHVVLIDTGAGELFGVTSGLLLSNLMAAGYRPEQIDTVLLTHIHADHSGGLSVGGVRQFPNATVYLDKKDLEYFVTRTESADESDTTLRQLLQSRATVGPYVKADKIALITTNGAVAPGITAISEPGHTPGHTAYLVQNSGHALLCWGDIIHFSEVQFRYPAVTVVYDTAPKEAVQARLREFQVTASRGLLVASAHISFPGLGHVRKDGAGYRWAPIPYTATTTELDPRQ
jgi:glyoxylase-like metal-dependent hydrolase (beta-lactamase superfamily II)